MLLRGSDESQDRTLVFIGTGLVLLVITAVLVVVTNPFGGQASEQISVAIDTPYVGQGIEPGTAVVMHGVVVGEVTAVSNSPGGGVRLVTDLQKQPVAGLTDAVNIDFRPINYFGVPGVNIIPTAGGQPLRNGSQVSLTPKGNSTLSELLAQLGDVSAGALTPQLVSVIDRVTRYTDGLNPLFETVLIATKAVADVQTVSTAQLLVNSASASSSFPGFFDTVIEAGDRFTSLNVPILAPGAPPPPPGQPPFLEGVRIPDFSDETAEFWPRYGQYLELASSGLFAALGKLLYSHVDDLLPLINGIKPITDAVPTLVRPQDFGATIVELRKRFETLYAGNSGQRALQVRILLDSLPGVAAPLGVVGGAE